MYSAEVICDSIAPGNVRLTTMVVTFPRIVLAEQNTHRVFSRNTASSRAIPVETRCAAIEQNPFVPEAFGKNQKGMQADTFLAEEENKAAEAIWREALADSLRHARALAKLGVHKQYANRLTEPFSWVTQIVTATEWDNYMNLRCHKAAQPEIKKAAELMRDALIASEPKQLCRVGEYHLPLVSEEDKEAVGGHHEATGLLLKLSVARCAAVSYEKHNVKKSIADEVSRHDMLLSMGHMSPFEHQARVASLDEMAYNTFSGNFRAPWIQYRKTLPNEDCFIDKENHG
ncbi:MAG: hypothetical protein EBS53_00610 [Bacteroidetes bacterium]|jgi:thymidylate synthase ThyX|nr:hypothetical protein [Bacteroidota bacterium]